MMRLNFEKLVNTSIVKNCMYLHLGNTSSCIFHWIEARCFEYGKAAGKCAELKKPHLIRQPKLYDVDVITELHSAPSK